mgnify:CR=1 FL=1
MSNIYSISKQTRPTAVRGEVFLSRFNQPIIRVLTDKEMYTAACEWIYDHGNEDCELTTKAKNIIKKYI